MQSSTHRKHLPPTYWGKSMNCHVQALATAYDSVFAAVDLWLLDVLTSVPFGVVYREKDANRVLDCYIDPDVGLDRALLALHVAFEVNWWDATVDAATPIGQLENWSATGPVVLGPLDMGNLPYLFRSEIYSGIDHYVVVTEVEQGRIWLSDPEGVPCAQVTAEKLLPAWRASSVPEGRGAYMMRRIVPQDPCHCDASALVCALEYAADNLRGAQEQPRGGVHGLIAMAQEEEQIINEPSLRRGLTYVLPAKSQRSLAGLRFLQMLGVMPSLPLPDSLLSEGIALLQEQANECADVLGCLSEASPHPLQGLRRVALLEKQLTDVFTALARSIST